MNDDTFTTPPQAPQPNQLPETTGRIQGSGDRIPGNTDQAGIRGDRATAGEVIPTQPNLPVLSNIQTPTQEDIDEESPEQAEEKEIEEVKKKYKLTPKFNKWHELYLNSKSKETYLNATQSAIRAYSLDPVTQYNVARTIGWKNVAKVDDMAAQIAAEKGYTFEKFVDVAYLNMLKRESPEWWDRFGDLVGFRSMKPQVVVNTQNTQHNTQINVTDADKVSFNDQFRDFIKSS